MFVGREVLETRHSQGSRQTWFGAFRTVYFLWFVFASPRLDDLALNGISG